MSSEFGPPTDATPFGSSTPTAPWVWVLIPVGIVVIIGGAAVFLHSQRKARTPHDLPPLPLLPLSNNDALRAQRGRSRAFNERDLPSHQSRWYAAGPVRPTEEGLNELGEAPPPYEKQFAPPPPPSPPAAAVVHAHNLRSGLEADATGEAGPAPKSTPHSLAGSIRGRSGNSAVEMHELEAATATSTSWRSSRSSSSSVGSSTGPHGGASCDSHALSPFTMSVDASTAASSMPSLALVQTGPGAGIGTGAGAGPPPYEGPSEPGHDGQGGSGVAVPAPTVLADTR